MQSFGVCVTLEVSILVHKPAGFCRSCVNATAGSDPLNLFRDLCQPLKYRVKLKIKF